MSIRLVLAEDSFIVRRGLTAVIDATPGVELAGSCGDLDSLLRQVEAVKPDVVLTDIRMPPTNTDEGIRAAASLRRTQPDVGVVVLSQHLDAQYVLSFFRDGTAGRAYLLKENVYDPDQLLAAVHAVVTGGSMIDPQVTGALVQGRLRMEASPLAGLTRRELEALSCMAQGLDNKAIADAFSLSVRGVERHINSIFSKLGLREAQDVHRRVKAVLLYLAERD